MAILAGDALLTDAFACAASADLPGKPDEPNDGLSGGAIAGIAVGSTAVAGIGVFALIWFVIKKKSLAELLAIFKKK